MDDRAGALTAAPVVLAGYSLGVLSFLAQVLPPRSVVVVDDPAVLRRRDARAAAADVAVLAEIIDCDYLAGGAADCFYLRHRELAPAAVVPILDYAVPFAARLAERYGVPGAGFGAARLLRDKHLLRQVTAAAGIANPESEVVTSPGELAAFARQAGGPVVLKPSGRQASVGIRVLRTPADAAAAWQDCQDLDEGVFTPSRPMPAVMLAERCLHGPEFSVETMVYRGAPVFSAATSKFLFAGDRPVEQGHVHPADASPALTAALLGATAAVLAAVGMDTGFAHCEWIVEDGVPFLVECAGRMAGGGIIELADAAWDYDLVGQFYVMMAGGVPAPPPRAPDRYAAVWMTAAAQAGTIGSVTGIEQAQASPGVRHVVTAPAGSPAVPLRSSWDRLGSVLADGATPAQALARARHGLGLVRFEVRPGPAGTAGRADG